MPGSWLKSIIKYGKWYFLTGFLTKGLGFILLPVYSRYLSIAEYGTLSSINAIAQLFVVAISLYLDSAFGRYYHEYKNDRNKLVKLFSTVYIFVLLWGGIVVFFMISASKLILGRYVVDKILLVSFLAFLPQLFIQIGQLGIVFLRQSLQAKLVAFVQVFSAFLSVSLTIFFLVRVGWGLEARLLGNATASLFSFLFFTILFLRTGLLQFQFDLSELKQYLKYSVPLIPNIAGGWIASLSDRLIISHYDSVSSTGIYNFAFQIASLVYILHDAITQVIGPVFMSGLFDDKEKTLRRISKSSRWLFVFMLHVSFGALLFSKEAMMTILALGKGRSEYLSGFYLIPIFSLIYVFSPQYRLYTTVVSFHRKTWIVSSAGLIMAGVNLSLNLLFVPLFGRIAAVIATVMSTIVYTAWILGWASSLEKLHLNWLWYTLFSILYAGISIFVLAFWQYLFVVRLEAVVLKIFLWIAIAVFLRKAFKSDKLNE